MVRLMFAAVAAAVAFAAPAFAADAKYVRIVHAESGKVLAVTDDSTDAGARVVVAKQDDANESQQWQVVKDGEHLKIVNRKSGKVLDVNENSADEGAEIITWDEKTEDNDNQRWSWVGKDKGKQLKSKSSSHVLSVNEGKVLQKKADDTAKGLLWEVVEVTAK